MRPRVRGDLVALGDHALDDWRVARGGVVDGALAGVVAGDEEGGARVVLLQDVEKSGGVDVRPVVERQTQLTGDGARADVDTVGDAAKLGTRRVRCIGTLGARVAVAGRAVGEETPRRRAELTTGAAYSLDIPSVFTLAVPPSHHATHSLRAAQSGVAHGVPSGGTALRAGGGSLLQARSHIGPPLKRMACHERARSEDSGSKGDESVGQSHDDEIVEKASDNDWTTGSDSNLSTPGAGSRMGAGHTPLYCESARPLELAVWHAQAYQDAPAPAQHGAFPIAAHRAWRLRQWQLACSQLTLMSLIISALPRCGTPIPGGLAAAARCQ